MSKGDHQDWYTNKWEAKDYMKNYYSELKDEPSFYMKHYYNSFTKLPELVTRDQTKRNILDLGAGPCICYGAAAAAAGYSKEKTITYSDFVEDNLNAITKWVKKADGADDWSPHFNFLANLSGKSASEVEDGTRKTFKEVLHCDLKRPGVPVTGSENKYDIVITNLCLEGAFPNVEEWADALKKVNKMLTPGGILMMGGIGGLKFYPVGDIDFPAAPITKKVIYDLFVKDKALNFELIEEHWQDSDPATKTAESDSIFFLIAKKTS